MLSHSGRSVALVHDDAPFREEAERVWMDYGRLCSDGVCKSCCLCDPANCPMRPPAYGPIPNF